MEGNGKLLTIKEAADLAEVTESYIYKLIRKGHISIQSCSVQDKTRTELGQNKTKQMKKVKEIDITRFFNLSIQQRTEQFRTRTEPGQDSFEPVQNQDRTELTKEIIKDVIADYFQDRETQLMKPLEEMAVYRVGQLEERIRNIEKEKEMILQENETLRKAMKALPGPIEEVAVKLQQQETTISVLQQEKEKAIQHIQETTKELQTMQQEKEEQIQKFEEQRKELEAQQEKNLKEQEIKLKAEAEEQMKQLAEAWKKELEQARHPWWKFW